MSYRDTVTLVAAARTGNAAAIDALLVQNLPALRAFIRLRASPQVRARESCSDIVQSVCREILEKLPDEEFPTEGAFRKWLFAWAENKLRNRLRFHQAAKRDLRKEVAARTAVHHGLQLVTCYRSFCTPSQAAIANEEIARIEAVFDRLPADYREVITLAHVVGLSHAEIGAEMGRNAGASRSLLNRAMARLTTLLDRGSPGRS